MYIVSYIFAVHQVENLAAAGVTGIFSLPNQKTDQLLQILSSLSIIVQKSWLPRLRRLTYYSHSLADDFSTRKNTMFASHSLSKRNLLEQPVPLLWHMISSLRTTRHSLSSILMLFAYLTYSQLSI
jgi:hypothetical protein